MRWTDRQRAMLREMGIHLWAPDAETETVDAPAPVPARDAPARSTASATALAVPLAGGTPRAAPRRDDAVVGPGSPHEAASSAPRWPGLAPADWLVVSERLDAGDPQQEQLLENMLRAMGVGVVAPARESRAAFFAIGERDVGAAAASMPLTQAIETVAPRCVLAFGRAAAAALLGDDVPLGGLRGRVHVRDGVPVVITFSLAFLLRHPAEKAKAWADLCLAVGALSS